MLQKLIYRFALRRHYWRTVAFDELSELYTSMTLRSLAQSVIGIFVPIYLYHLHYDVVVILLFYAATYFFWQFASLAGAWLVARIGPKHSMLYSQVFFIIGLALLVSLESTNWPLALIAFFFGVSNGVYFLAFHIDFSKVKHSEHGGKELGWLFGFQRVGIALGPIVGGLVAYFFGAEYIFLVSIIVLFMGTVPLFFTAEPTKVHQKITFSELNLKAIKKDLIAYSAVGVENMVSMIIWPFFIGVFVFTKDPYIKLGVVTSASVIVAFVAAKSIGSIIDSKKGRKMLHNGITINAVLHLSRAFVSTFPVALIVNMINEVVTPMYRMAFIKGMYDAADDLPGRRIVYLSAMESTSTFARALFFCVAAALAFIFGPKEALIMCFVIGAVASMVIATERFRALN
jgi:MFS family permease